jgi:hypothetical protein
MSTTALVLAAWLAAADPSATVTSNVAASPSAQVDPRALVERSLPFLEKEATAWVEARKCATCHHVPMMIWTHHAARQRGFAVNESALLNLETLALEQYLGHPQLTPTGQDQGFLEKGLGPGTIYLTLGLKASAEPPKEALQRFVDNFAKLQNDDGSWPTKENGPPIIDGTDSITMLVLLATDGDTKTRQRALKWLKSAPERAETQSLALRALVAHRSGDREEAGRYVARLGELQQTSGGWSQTKDLPCDAVATGQALMAIGAVGGSPEMVRLAWNYLASTQQPDGSWAVHTRNPNTKSDNVISYFGTAWATLGLLETLPKR